MIRFLLIILLTSSSLPALAWYYNSVPGLTSGFSVQNNIISANAGSDVWLCTTRGSDRKVPFHVYGLAVRNIDVSMDFIEYSNSGVGVPSLQQCRDATDEGDSKVKVAHYRILKTVSVPVNEGDYSVCWSGWDGLGKDARCEAGFPITPVDDCESEIVYYPNDLGTVIAGDPIDRNFQVADLTIRCKTAVSTTLEIFQQASPDNVLQQVIKDENGNRLEGLVSFQSGVAKPIYMYSTGTPTVAQQIEDSVVVTINYQ